MKKLISEVIKTIVPNQSQINSNKKIANLAFSLVKTQIKNFPEVVGVEFGGSFAKGTWLSKKADIDIFIKFNEEVSEEKFVEISKKIGFYSMKDYNPYVRYSEHPYVEARIKQTRINIVPCYDVKLGKWKSSADRSPFHTKHMKKALTPKMRNEVRLLKTFLKYAGIYGAEIAKEGFSGYVSEVLILHFKSFENVINSISKIRENQVIGSTTKKFDTSIVIIDPVDSNRNLASAISEENIGKFILSCRAFQINPSKKFFNETKLTPSKPKLENILVIKFNFKIRSPDIIWGQIKRATRSLKTQIELGGFKVLRNTSYTDEKNEAFLIFLLESTQIPDQHYKMGPDFFREKDCRNFIAKNIKKTSLMWINSDKKIVSLEKRVNFEVLKFATDFLKNNLSTALPKGLHEDFEKGFRIFLGTKNLPKSIKEVVDDLISTDATFFYFD